ncbi:hypothetical protein [uncultured Shimia sp.]|uniref:hypothetical protein n=1 Tax=uncultured Shimia sp. TaxID=573152 RepID=UPI0025EABF4A|nr:hypothetical protein [uncultured Shimia sp.]
MKRLILAGVLAVAAAGTALAQSWQEPARGTQTRKDLMSAIRPIAEWRLGAPVQFVVKDLRVAGDVGYGRLYAQRPGGAKIDLNATPISQRMGGAFFEDWEEPYIDVMYKKSGNMWVAVEYTLSASEAWWASPAYCAAFGPVLTEWCH